MSSSNEKWASPTAVALGKLADAQGEVVRTMKEAIKADKAAHTKEELDAAIAKLVELKTKANDPMLALENPAIKAKYDLVRSVGEECVTEGELATLLSKKPDSFVLYDGFEPSGRMHIAQGVFKAMNVNKCTKAGGTFIFWVADWFALMNDKMGGDLEKIKTVGKYLVEVWKATGMDMDRVKFIWSSDEISAHADDYWTQALDIARRTTITRVKKCCQIMGRRENKLTAAQILYPLMQATDIFFLKADICQLGVDQRKVNMLAREYVTDASAVAKPIILSHHMLYGLKKGQEKMSKSDPDSAIFMEDTVEDVARKLNSAYCPKVSEAPEAKKDEEEEMDAGLESMHLAENDLKNPCLDYVEHILFSVPGQSFECGGAAYTSFAAVKEAFLGDKIDEATLKAALIVAINKLLDPVRKHFAENAEAKALLAQMSAWKGANLEPPKGLKRLVATDAAKGPVWAVFAPPANDTPNLGEICSVLQALAGAPADHQVVLWCPDWTSFVLNQCGGDRDFIQQCYVLLVELLRALRPDLMARTTVLMQREAILKDPSQYWISVINVGRHFQLQRVREVNEANEFAGQVIAGLMHVGDVLALGPATLSCVAGSVTEASHKLALSFFEDTSITELALPKIHAVPPVETNLKENPLADPGVVNADDDIYLGDTDKDVARKIKRAFCAEGNVDRCPPITLTQACVFAMGGSFVISRKPENGGDRTYRAVEELAKDFADKSLHPGDLKPAVVAGVNQFLQPVRDCLKSNDAAKKADKAIKDAQKKAAAALKKKK